MRNWDWVDLLLIAAIAPFVILALVGMWAFCWQGIVQILAWSGQASVVVDGLGRICRLVLPAIGVVLAFFYLYEAFRMYKG